MGDYATVQTWASGLREQWGEAPADLDGRIDSLGRFCDFVGEDPDTMIAACTREVESGKRIRIKARRLYSEKIAEFQAAAGGDARAQARAGNIIRSFFIHNGIFMQAGVQA
jgi:hypothetical protein